MKNLIKKWTCPFKKQKTVEKTQPLQDSLPLLESAPLFASSFKKLQNLTLEEVMIPRADIVAVSSKFSLDEVVSLFLEKKMMALPIFRDSLDHITGMLTVHDVLALLHQNKEEIPWHKKISPVLFSPDSMSALEGFTLLRERHQAFLLVVDEYGGVDGLVSLARLLQEMGDILNIWEDEDLFETIQREDGAHVVDGRLDLEAFEEEFGPFLSDIERKGDIETIGGLACALAGRVPLRGEAIPYPFSGALLEILEADPRRVKRVAVHLAKRS